MLVRRSWIADQVRNDGPWCASVGFIIMIFRIGTMLARRSWMPDQVRHDGGFCKGVSVSTS